MQNSLPRIDNYVIMANAHIRTARHQKIKFLSSQALRKRLAPSASKIVPEQQSYYLYRAGQKSLIMGNFSDSDIIRMRSNIKSKKEYSSLQSTWHLKRTFKQLITILLLNSKTL